MVLEATRPDVVLPHRDRVADLEARDISERCRVWSEPSVVDKALHEFSETEQFLRAAEDITGQDYVWKRYDLVCLAPS